MKSKRLFQILVLLALLFNPMGNEQPVRAVGQLDAEIVLRDLIDWNGSYGYVNSGRYEKWQFTLSEPVHQFRAGATRMEGDLLPLVILFDANGDELIRGQHISIDPLPAGDYSIQVQPQTGEGLYLLTVQAEFWDKPMTSHTVSRASMYVGETTTVTVNLENMPPEGYTSAEFTCYFSENLVEPDNLVILDRFGPDPVVAVNTPYPDRFIVAISGSHGNKATADGPVFTFDIEGLQPGQALFGCYARVSQGGNALTALESYGGNVIVWENALTPTPDPATCDKVEFIADITVPAGSVFTPGATFTKSWRLKNVGSCTWTTAYQLVFYDGEQMGARASANLPAPVPPGATIGISLEMTAPSTAGSYRGNWLFRNSRGALFGTGPQANQPWSVDIVVSGPSLTPTQTATPSATFETPNTTATPSLTPSGPTPTPMSGIVYDFVAQAPSAFWYSGAGLLPYPGLDGSPNGFVFKVDYPRLETSATNTRSGLLTVPQNIQNGYIQGFYPPFHVQAGDRFRAILSCEGGATNCYAAYRLDYQTGSDPIRTFWGPFLERYDGKFFTADVDLSPLAGKDVKFILTVLAAGVASGDRMLWVDPIIYRTSPIVSSTPATEGVTSTPMDTPTVTPVVPSWLDGKVVAGKPVAVDLYDANNVLLGSIETTEDGVFSGGLTPGRYSIVARASGFLSAQASIDLTLNSLVMPTINLPAGDIDGNNVIDQYDALTIGMNYNAALPSAADLNNDGTINVLDLELLARNYRKTGPVPWTG